MPKKSGMRNLSDPIERVPFKIILAGAAVSTSYNAPTITSDNLSPAIDVRLNAIADVFQYYRFTQLKVSLMPYDDGTNEATVSSGYIPRVPNTAPTTHNQIMNLPGSVFKGFGQTIPASYRLGKSVLIADAPLKWYQTIVGTEDTQWEIQGVLYHASNGKTASSPFVYIVEGVCEFKGRSAASQTPMFLQPKTPTVVKSSFPSIPAQDNAPPEIVVGGQKFKMVSA